MGRVLGQPPTVLRYEKTILAVEETTSAGRCGSSLAAFLCPAFVCPCGSAAQGIFSAQGIFYLPKGVKEYESEIYLPQLWDPLGV